MSLAMKARQKVRKKATKDKTFGCDLLEHLTISGLEVPQVLRSCAEFVEEHGIVDGIYRLCGIASSVHKLRQEFAMDRQPDLSKDTYLQDVHCVSSLCKAYFRELPNPLLTYQLYDKFAEAVAIQLEEQRLVKIKEVLKDLPHPHYRTLEYLMRHLLRMASFSSQTNMHARNLAIVWAPNLLRSKDIESSGFNGTAAFMEVRIQSIVVEFILNHVEQLFGDMPLAGSDQCSITNLNSPSCVREDYFRSLTYNIPSVLHQGDGPPQMRPYHTIIELSDHKRKGSLKAKKWKSIFNLGRSNNDSKRKANKQDEKDSDKTDKVSLRPAKSMDSLSSVPYASEAIDSENRSLVRSRSPKSVIPLRRDSFGTKPGNDYTFSGEQPIQLETCHQTEYEEESKSEPTTPKPGRSSIVVSPQGRSPKSAQNRAEKCLGVHISEPFSVTLPRHITSNLSRLTRGMECPSLINPVLHRSSEKISSEEESPPQAKLVKPNADAEENNKEKSDMLNDIGLLISDVKLDTLMPDKVRECMETDGSLDMNEVKLSDNSDRSLNPVQEKSGIRHPGLITERNQVDPSIGSPNAKENGCPLATTDKQDPDTEKKRISLEVQDSFSFLDNQDMSPESSALDADEDFLGYDSRWVPGEEELRCVYMTDMITYCKQTEEFSVEPPPDDLSTEDNEDMYSMPADCLDILEISEDMDNNSDDIFLSAYDELSPLVHESGTMFVVENSKDSLRNETELGESCSQNVTTDSDCEVIKATPLELEPLQHTINISTEALQDSMGDSSVLPETNAASERHQPKHHLQQHEGSTEHVLKSESMLHNSLPKANLHLLNLGLKTTHDTQVSTPVQGLDIKMLILDIQQGHSNDQECSTDCDGTSADTIPLTDCVTPASENVPLTDTPILENVPLKDTSASENVLLTDTLASENFILTDTSASENVLLTGSPASQDVLLTDSPVSENVLLTDSTASDNVLQTDILVSENILLTESTDSDNVLLTRSPASEDVLLTDSPASDNVLLTEPPASDNVLLTEPPASDNVLLTRSPASEDDLLTDSPASKKVLLTDRPASEHVLLTDPTDSVQPEEGSDHKQNKDLPTCSAQDTSVSMQVTQPQKTENKLIPAVFPDGSVSMKQSTTPHKVHQVKAVPVVPPKPQFAKLPPALKSKIHVSPASNISKDSGSQKSDSIATVEEGNLCSQSPQGKKRSSWRSGGSISFDTAVAQARERKMSQYPIRRMQTYSVGESQHVLDTPKEDVTLHCQTFAQKPGGSRPHSCVIALNSLEVSSKGNNIDEDTKRSQMWQGCKYVKSQEATMAPHGQSPGNRLSMPRLGKQTEELSGTCEKPKRRSLL
ncbi:rho GTPase-activating protein 30 [Xenopus laevis]|uniref:Rho GTPase-activating protein 30 n=2 Tax=Xenopus laevis TaxID=8355 RepID=A0A1L8FDI5_XENLA|nr:rho GTPase-activating protein 30 [Xenopus laevis]OCT69659.1 hypothetical protein XELAEV_18040971mg [Xenopus laevis]